MQSVNVGLGDRGYTITIGSELLPAVGQTCRQAGLKGTAAVITNPTVGKLYFDAVSQSLVNEGYKVHRIDIGDGEQYKNIETLNDIYTSLIAGRLDRGSFIIALGGGVVGDIAGFAASTFLRGIPFIQVPTTLLAQVDSSVGGKTGINHPLGKNLIGSFYQPRHVVIDIDTLHTLPEREVLGGLAEVVKYGVVFDKDFFSYLSENAENILSGNKDCLGYLVKRCCELKAWVVEQDERESGLRAVLNYGHTLGHAVEMLTGYKKFVHGEAVSIGMVQAAKISEAKGLSTSQATATITGLLCRLGLPTELPLQFPASGYKDALLRDKKVRHGGLTFVLNKEIGGFAMETVEDIDSILATCGVRG